MDYAEPELSTKPVTFLFTDIEGSTRLWEAQRAAMQVALARHDHLLRHCVETHHGRIVKATGDGVHAAFARAPDALRAAMASQKILSAEDWPDPIALKVRMALHTGTAEERDGDYYGPAVNRAARLACLGYGGQTLLSQATLDLCRESMPPEVAIKKLGEYALKDLSQPEFVFEAYPAGAEQEFPPLRTPLALPNKPSIAVLAFQNISDEAEQEYFAEGVVEEIITELSRIRWFFVISRNSSFIYKGRAVDVRRVGLELGIRYVLEGSVQKVGNRVRVTAQLLETINGSHVWADKFDRDLGDVLAIQDEITRQVVTAIEPAMFQRENVLIGRKNLKDYTAFDCYLRGIWYLNKISPEGYVEASKLFRRSIERDPQSPLGYVGLARILYGGATIYGWSEHPERDLRESLDAAEKAITLDENDAYAHFAYAGAALYLGQHQKALDAARHAIFLNPNVAYGQLRLGQVLIYCGQPADAVEPIERSIRQSPFDPQLGTMYGLRALALYQSKQYAQAVTQAQAAIEHNFVPGHVLLAAALARLGHIDEARRAVPGELLARALRDSPRLANYVNEADRSHFLGGLMLAGLDLGGGKQTR